MVKGPSRILARRGKKVPRGYTTRYEFRESEYATGRRKVFVKKKKKTPKSKK